VLLLSAGFAALRLSRTQSNLSAEVNQPRQGILYVGGPLLKLGDNALQRLCHDQPSVPGWAQWDVLLFFLFMDPHRLAEERSVAYHRVIAEYLAAPPGPS
jgi:hypothetical protein